MGLPPSVLAAQITAWETPLAHPPLGLRCIVLCAAHRLSLALPAEQFPAVADCVLSLASVFPHGPMDPGLPRVAGGRAAARRTESRSDRCPYGCAKCEDRGGIRRHPRL